MKPFLSSRAATIAFLLLALAGSPAFAKDLRCQFQASGGQNLNFGTLNPASGATVTMPVTAAALNANSAGDCVNIVTMTISGGNGNNFSGSRRLKNTTTAAYIPYSLTSISTSGPGNNNYVVFTLQGTILGSDYQNASAGSYSDTVMVSVTP